jgi:hypothetical protein
MARNLYDLGDAPQNTDAWLNERGERSLGIVPRGAVLLALVLGGAGFLLLRDQLPGPTGSRALPPTTILDSFALCDDPAGTACVLAPDSYAWHGHPYHVADIIAPSLAEPRCPQEAELAGQGRATLLALMNGGTFEAHPDPIDAGARMLVRDGVSLGSLLVLKGYAKPAGGPAVSWCAAT